jgi:hypothetical protein
VSAISLLRIDGGDHCVSTHDALSKLYDRVLPGGFIYVKNYGKFDECKATVDRFRENKRELCTMYGLRERESSDEKFAVWWQKSLH